MLLKNVEDDDDDEIIFGSDDETTKQKKKSKSDLNTLFASAEEFASLLDDEGSSKRAPGGSNAFSNKDKACKYLALADIIDGIIYFLFLCSCQANNMGRKPKSMGARF